MHISGIFAIFTLITASVASTPRTLQQHIPELPQKTVWPARLTAQPENDKRCQNSAILLVREEGRQITILDLAGRHLIATVPLKADGSASLEIFSAAFHAYLDVIVPAGSAPRALDILKSRPDLCRYRLTPR